LAELAPPDVTITFAVIGDAVVLPIVMPITVACVPEVGAYTLARDVVAFLRKKFLKVLAI
jgi:hypothetical protein